MSHYSYWIDLQEIPARFVVHAHASRVVLQIPTNDHLICILVGWPIGEFNRVRAKIDQEYHAAIQLTAPRLAAVLSTSRRMERYVGTADLPNFFRKPYGPGWALVGDAGYHKDPVNAHGISDAFRDAALLAAAVHAALIGEKAWTDALASYEQQRNEAAFPLYEQNCRAASFTPPLRTNYVYARRCGRATRVILTRALAPSSAPFPRNAFFMLRIWRVSWVRRRQNVVQCRENCRRSGRGTGWRK